MNSFLLSVRPYRSLLIIVLLAGSLIECKCWKKSTPTEAVPQVAPSANIVLNPSDKPLSDEAIKKLIRGNTSIPADAIKIKHCPCDPNLINVTLPENWEFTGQEGDVATKPRGGGQSGGEDIDLGSIGTIAINQSVSPLDESQFLPGGATTELDVRRDSIAVSQLAPVDNNKTAKNEDQAIRIAVFDSGLNPNYIKSIIWDNKPTTLCQTDLAAPAMTSNRGWNFVADPINALTADDQQVKHGSRVSYFLANQFSGSSVPVKIIPMKVLDKTNTGDLFGVLCAMETARKNGVDIFNMSLGYYGDRDAVFAQYIKRAVDQGIWIVTAAGNQPDSTQDRNLSTRAQSFYPAFFSKEKEFTRVIAVTTMNGNSVCNGQNFDQNFVVGVIDDKDCRFKLINSGSPGTVGVFGTSYATPIVAGWLGRTLREQNLDPKKVTRQQLIDKMQVSSPTVPGLYQSRFIKRN